MAVSLESILSVCKERVKSIVHCWRIPADTSSVVLALRSGNVLFSWTWNLFPLLVKCGRVVGQMHPWTPPSYPYVTLHVLLRTWNLFPLQVTWGRVRGQMHSWIPPSYPCVTSLSSFLLNTTCHSHLNIFKFCSSYKLSKKTREVYFEASMFWS